jgi:hypothetical protein
MKSQSLFELREPYTAPLTLFVGEMGIPVRINSLQFRRAFRAVLKSFSEWQEELSNDPKWRGERIGVARNYPMSMVCKKALLYVLSLEVDGKCSTLELADVVPLADHRPHQSRNAMWWRLLKDRFQPRMPMDKKHLQRLVFVNSASQRCSPTLLKKSISAFECYIEEEVFPNPVANWDAADNLNKQCAAVASIVQSPVPWLDSDPPLAVARNGGFYGFTSIPVTTLSNTLILGGTGSGKTASGLSPLLSAMLSYQLADGTVPAMLVIDPKRELESKVRDVLAANGQLDRLVVIGACAPIAMFTTDCNLSASDRFEQMREFTPASKLGSDQSYWENLGVGMVLDWIKLETLYEDHTGGIRLIALLLQDLGISQTGVSEFWSQLLLLLSFTCTTKKNLKRTNAAMLKRCEAVGVQSPSMNVMEPYAGETDLIQQWCYLVMSAQSTVGTLASVDLARLVDFDVIPVPHRKSTNIAELIDQGKVILFCPEPSVAHQMAAKAIKRKVYDSVFDRKNMEQPVFIVVDEAQAFLTDTEINLIDRCRAYRAMVVVATQSISSLKHALGSTPAAQVATEIFAANTPSKFVYRSTDAETVAWLRTQIPPPSDGGVHIVDARRPAGLKPGESYYVLADGTWGRGRAQLADVA